VLLLHTRLNC